MSHKSKVSLTEQLRLTLFNKLAINRSKFKDKQDHIDCKQYIYSWQTYKNYYKQGKAFLKFLKAKGYKCRTLEDCRQYCNLWLQDSIDRGLSPYTIKLYTATLSKIYSTSSDAFIKTPARHRRDVFRSRRAAVRDKNVNPDTYADMISYLSATGLRRNEAYSIRGRALIADETGYHIRVESGTKGGRPRDVIIVGDVDKVVSMMKAAGDGKVFPGGIPSSLDVHNLRALYAANLMKHLIKTEGIPDDPKDRIFLRGELKGMVLSRHLSKKVALCMGHTRTNVISQGYMYHLTQEDLKQKSSA